MYTSQSTERESSIVVSSVRETNSVGEVTGSFGGQGDDFFREPEACRVIEFLALDVDARVVR